MTVKVNDVKSGASGAVSHLKPSLTERFSHRNGLVLKKFHTDNPLSDLDFESEIRALQFLDVHRKNLPFSVPKLLDFGTKLGEESTDGIAQYYIKMTALRQPLPHVNGQDISFDDGLKQRYQEGKALAHFHKLPVDVTKTPLTDLIAKRYKFNLNSFGVAPLFAEEIAEITSSLDNLSGEAVFLHGDMFYRNVCAEGIGMPITGVLDFGQSGFGVKELDFKHSLNEPPEFQKAFQDGYEEVSDEGINVDNIHVIGEYLELIDKMRHMQRISSMDLREDKTTTLHQPENWLRVPEA